jgi:hypothetical protein
MNISVDNKNNNMTCSCMITHTCHLRVICLLCFNWCATQDAPFNLWAGSEKKKEINLDHPLMVIAHILLTHPSVHLLGYLTPKSNNFLLQVQVHPQRSPPLFLNPPQCPLGLLTHLSGHPLGHLIYISDHFLVQV